MLLRLSLVVLMVAGAALASPRLSLRGGHSGGQSGGRSGPAENLERQVFERKITDLITKYGAASDGFHAIELKSGTALSTGDVSLWTEAGADLAQLIGHIAGGLEPALETVGDLLEGIFEGTEGFAEPAYCDSVKRLVDGVDVYDDPLLGLAISFIEDMGCFKNKMGFVKSIDVAAMGADTYNEHEAVAVLLDFIDNSHQLAKGLEEFVSALARLDASKKKSLGSSDKMHELVRLLKELDLDSDK